MLHPVIKPLLLRTDWVTCLSDILYDDILKVCLGPLEKVCEVLSLVL